MKKCFIISLILASFCWGFGGVTGEVRAAIDCADHCKGYLTGGAANAADQYDGCVRSCENANAGIVINDQSQESRTTGSDEADLDRGWAQTTSVAKNPCDNLPDEGRAKCNACLGNPDRPTGVWTGLGCVSTEPIAAFGQILTFMLGLGGFFVLVQILVGAFGLVASKGNPKAVQDARERITNAVIALLFIVFSVTILEFVGVTVFNIPGFFDSTPTTSAPPPSTDDIPGVSNCTKAGGCNCLSVQLTDRCQAGEFEVPTELPKVNSDIPG